MLHNASKLPPSPDVQPPDRVPQSNPESNREITESSVKSHSQQDHTLNRFGHSDHQLSRDWLYLKISPFRSTIASDLLLLQNLSPASDRNMLPTCPLQVSVPNVDGAYIYSCSFLLLGTLHRRLAEKEVCELSNWLIPKAWKPPACRFSDQPCQNSSEYCTNHGPLCGQDILVASGMAGVGWEGTDLQDDHCRKSSVSRQCTQLKLQCSCLLPKSKWCPFAGPS